MTIEELEQIAESVRLENGKFDYEVNVCMDLACSSQGSEKLREALVKAAEESGKRCWCAAPAAWDRARPARWCGWILKRRFTGT